MACSRVRHQNFFRLSRWARDLGLSRGTNGAVPRTSIRSAKTMRYPVRGILIVIALLGAVWLLQAQWRPLVLSASEPRQVAARGALSDFEQTTISIFERVSPSVVQVFVQRGGGGLSSESEGLEPGQAGTGTGSSGTMPATSSPMRVCAASISPRVRSVM